MSKARYYFFLNPYKDFAFTHCPKCDATTKLRKFPLVIHIEPATLCVLNKTCRVCPSCELLITRKSEIEPLLMEVSEDVRLAVQREKYVVVGTLDRADWRKGIKGPWSSADAIDRVWPFRDHWTFVIEGGWRPADA